jgi:hypothetical protein
MTDEIQREAIEDAWTTPTPSAGFADRVLAQHFADAAPQAPPRRSTRTVMVATAAVLLVLVGLVWALRGRAPVQDELHARRVETVALGDRATAVAQPGAMLAWSVDFDGTTRIDQTAGRVFYRVDHGERFDVITPEGTVTVTGTCFEVDVQPKDASMPQKSNNLRAGALGAAFASALVVTVYEGGVVLANDEGSVDVHAGQAARATGDRAPVRFDPDDPDHALADAAKTPGKSKTKRGELAGDPMAHIQRQARDLDRIRQEKDDQAARIRELEEQVVALGGSTDPKSPEGKKARARRCATQSRGSGCPFLEPDQETLDEMARCATVKIDSLGFTDNPDPPQADVIAERLGITDPSEREKVHEAALAQYDSHTEQLRAMYLELGGEEATAEDASGKTLQSFIFDQLDPETMGDIQRQIAEERAGQREAPANVGALSIEERVARLMAENGNEFERLVADRVGKERARELRRRQDGWPGSTSVHSGDCR